MEKPPKILILNGPNLNLLGQREPEIYGTETLSDIHDMCEEYGQKNGLDIDFRQSNHEGQLIDWIQDALEDTDAVMINAAGYTHTSVAIHDALKILDVPIVEIHISDPEKREKFRHFSYIAPTAIKVIKGKGTKGYTEGLDFLKQHLSTN
jgi:3-dehydroquinate dehydratase-2